MRKKKTSLHGTKNGHQIGVRDCRYIIGEVGSVETTHFCGQPVQEGSPYCETHHRACYDGKPRHYLKK